MNEEATRARQTTRADAPPGGGRAREGGTPSWAAVGPVQSLGTAASAALFDRGRASDPQVRARVAEIIDAVREHGDAALRVLARRYDRVELAGIEVPREVVRAALDGLDGAVRDALEQAKAALTVFHRAQLPWPQEIETQRGVRVGRRAEALRRVGVYAPGGRATYPSSVLMGAVPAKVAGVDEVMVCSPPAEDGFPPRAVLAACALAGADRVYALGGAGAIAALAFGTESVPRVDRIVGPGNAYVAEAKRQLHGIVATDCPAGPSEVLVVADHAADATLVAAELIAQAEHDPDAAAVLVTTSPEVLAGARRAAAELMAALPTRGTIQASLSARGGLLLVDTLEEAFAFARRYAPEHLVVMTREPRLWLEQIRGAGSVFLGASSAVAFGDYLTGANHVLPTGGLSRAFSGLSSADFLRFWSYQEVAPAAAVRLAAPTAALAAAEGLPAHALAARLRGSLAAPEGAAPAGGDGARRPAAVRRRAAYAAIEPYDPQRGACAVDLSDNTNLFGAHPVVRRAIARAPSDRLTRYPSVYAEPLKAAIARYHGVTPAHVATGCGSDDVIDSAIRAFSEAGEALAYPDPTFGMIATFARMNGVSPQPVALGPGFTLDPDALIAVRAPITYVCRPNNPTGTLFARDAVERLAREAPGVVLLDEAYADYAGDDLVSGAAASDRLIVLRTFSKAYGLAGLRVGYAVGPPVLIREIEKSRGPYKVGGVAEAAALAVLEQGLERVRRSVQRTRTNRERLAAALTEGGFAVAPSAANFLLVAVPGAPALAWARALRARGIGVRPFPNVPQMGDCIRVSIGPWPMLARFLVALRAVAERTSDDLR